MSPYGTRSIFGSLPGIFLYIRTNILTKNEFLSGIFRSLKGFRGRGIDVPPDNTPIGVNGFLLNGSELTGIRKEGKAGARRPSSVAMQY